MQLDNKQIAGEENDMLYAYSSQAFCHIDRMVIPWKGEPSPLVSLLDMIKICAGELWDFMQALEALFKDGLFDVSRSEFTPTDLKRIEEVIDKASSWCKLVELEAASKVIKHIEFTVKYVLSWWPDAQSPAELGTNIWTLRLVIEDELRERFFMFIPKNQAPWYEKEDGFGINVSKAFPSAVEDIKEVGTCYATGRYTACVFHSMRVLEHGLRALAKNVGLSFDVQQWYDIINQIFSKIKEEEQKLPKSIEKSERLQFLKEAAKEFFYFKDAWRNHVSHGRPGYDGPEALRVLNHVKAFMIHLSKKLSG